MDILDPIISYQTSAHCLQQHFAALISVLEPKYFRGSYLINPATREMSV
jgi:hypothetical protein